MNKQKKLKFLVIGATGLIGERLCRELDQNYLWTGTTYQTDRREMIKMDITDRASVDDVMSRVRPAHVLLCANLSGGVRFCENNPDIAQKWHFEGTAHVAGSCLKHSAKLLYISSECVFDGKIENCTEESPVNPLNVYGAQKLKSEEWIQKNLHDYVIVRTMSVFGWQTETKSPNAVLSAYFALSKGKKYSVDTHRFSTPTYVGDLAKALIELSLSDKNGLYHVCGPSYLSRFEWLKKTSDYLGWDSRLIVPEDKINPRDVRYPSKIRLNTSKFQSQFQTVLHPLEQALSLLKGDVLCINSR